MRNGAFDPVCSDPALVVLRAFVPDDDESSMLMRVYLSFAGVAVCDPRLRDDQFFEAERGLRRFLVEQFANHPMPERAARALIWLVLGLALGVVLEETDVRDADDVLMLAYDSIRSAAS